MFCGSDGSVAKGLCRRGGASRSHPEGIFARIRCVPSVRQEALGPGGLEVIASDHRGGFKGILHAFTPPKPFAMKL